MVSDISKPSVLVSAGIHGEEPAGVFAILEFMRRYMRKYLDRFSFYVFPCINPFGFERGIRGNKDGFDLNRQFEDNDPPTEVALLKQTLGSLGERFMFALDIHEIDPDYAGEGYTKEDNPHDLGRYLFV